MAFAFYVKSPYRMDKQARSALQPIRMVTQKETKKYLKFEKRIKHLNSFSLITIEKGD